jgi:hypothetical protein
MPAKVCANVSHQAPRARTAAAARQQLVEHLQQQQQQRQIKTILSQQTCNASSCGDLPAACRTPAAAAAQIKTQQTCITLHDITLHYMLHSI